MKRYYLAYGSNLNVEQMRFRCPTAKIVGVSTIKGYKLLFKGSMTGSYLTIEKDKASNVPVGVWEVTASDERALDRYEGCPSFYYKTEIEVPLTDLDNNITTIKAFVYIMHEERALGIPSKAYIETCASGYQRFGFDMGYLRDALAVSMREVL